MHWPHSNQEKTMHSAQKAASTSIMSLIGILFIALKLIGVIDWSWWWVLAPFWGSAALLVIIFIIAGVIVFIREIRN